MFVHVISNRTAFRCCKTESLARLEIDIKRLFAFAVRPTCHGEVQVVLYRRLAIEDVQAHPAHLKLHLCGALLALRRFLDVRLLHIEGRICHHPGLCGEVLSLTACSNRDAVTGVTCDIDLLSSLGYN